MMDLLVAAGGIVAALSLILGALRLLFGQGILLRIYDAARGYFDERRREQRQVADYLHHSVMYLDGLPLFIEKTWAWGPSVPNYAADGSVPAKTPFVVAVMPSVCAAVHDFQALYDKHSQTHGRPFTTLEETLRHLDEIKARFWSSLEAFAKKKWPLRWRLKLSALRALQIPTSEHDRIRKFH